MVEEMRRGKMMQRVGGFPKFFCDLLAMQTHGCGRTMSFFCSCGLVIWNSSIAWALADSSAA
jgi:hypothetical protein